jgi:hypothetical protein
LNFSTCAKSLAKITTVSKSDMWPSQCVYFSWQDPDLLLTPTLGRFSSD